MASVNHLRKKIIELEQLLCYEKSEIVIDALKQDLCGLRCELLRKDGKRPEEAFSYSKNMMLKRVEKY